MHLTAPCSARALGQARSPHNVVHSSTISVYVLQMYGEGWKGLIFVLISAHALFCLATATTCTSPCKLPTLFSPGSVNRLLTSPIIHSYY